MSRLRKFSLLFSLVSLLVMVFNVTAADEYTYLYSLPEEELAPYALSGNTALVGFENETVKAYISSPTGWSEQAMLTPTSSYEDYQFYGRDLAIDGDTAAVSLTGYCERGGGGQEPPDTQGSVFIFQRTGTTWTQQQQIMVPCSVDRIAIHGTTLAVSEYGEFEGYEAFIHFFEYTGASWVAAGSAQIDGLNGGSNLAGPAAIHGDTAVVLGEAVDGFESAPVILVFKRSGGIWSLQTTLPGPAEPHNPLSITFDGQTAVLGNLVYVLNGSAWTLQQTLDVPYEGDPFYFSTHVAVEGDHAIVSSEATYAHDPVNPVKHTYLFRRTGMNWTSIEMLVNGQAISGELWISGNLALVGPHTFEINDSPIEPTSTPVATDEPTPVVTDEPTSSPTETSTPQTDTALNANTGFEASSIEPWKVKDSSGDKLKCSSDKPIAYSGDCAFKFSNGKGSSGKLVQKIDFSTRVNPVSGNGLELSLYAKTKGGAEGNAKVVVRFADGSRQKFGVDLTDTAKAYMAFSKSETLTQTAISKVKLVIKGTNAQGKLFVDDVAVRSVNLVGTLDTLPLP